MDLLSDDPPHRSFSSARVHGEKKIKERIRCRSGLSRDIRWRVGVKGWPGRSRRLAQERTVSYHCWNQKMVEFRIAPSPCPSPARGEGTW